MSLVEPEQVTPCHSPASLSHLSVTPESCLRGILHQGHCSEELPVAERMGADKPLADLCMLARTYRGGQCWIEHGLAGLGSAWTWRCLGKPLQYMWRGPAPSLALPFHRHLGSSLSLYPVALCPTPWPSPVHLSLHTPSVCALPIAISLPTQGLSFAPNSRTEYRPRPGAI